MSLVGAGTNADRQHTYLVVVGALRPDGISQPSALSHFLKQPARQATTQDMVEDSQGPALLRMPSRCRQADHEVGLFGGLAGDDHRWTRILWRLALGGGPSLAGGEATVDVLGQRVVVQ